MYSIIPEAWKIHTCKCFIGTVAYTYTASDTKYSYFNILSFPEYSSVLHNVYMTGKLTLCVTCKPRWQINSSEISVCWSCVEKIIKIKRALSVILLASPASCHSFQLSLQLPTVTPANIGFNAQWATANAR